MMINIKIGEIFNVWSKAASVFSLTFTCVSQQNKCEKNEAQVQRDVALVGHFASTEGHPSVLMDFTCRTCA